MEQIEVRKYIRKYGKYKSGKGRTAEYAVICTACGKEILNTDPEEADVVVTKRSTPVFFHRKCAGNVWNTKIQWKDVS